MPESDNNYAGQDGHQQTSEAQSAPRTEDTQSPQPLCTSVYDPRILEDIHIPLCLEAVLDMGSSVSSHAAKARVDRLLETAKKADDPIEKMILEQLCLAHHHIAALHARTAKSTDIKTISAYSSATQRLLAEWRRLVHELREHRAPLQGKQTTVIHKVEQLNHAKHQDVAFTKAGDPEGGSRMEALDTELGSNDEQETANELLEGRQRRLEEPQASCCGAA